MVFLASPAPAPNFLERLHRPARPWLRLRDHHGQPSLLVAPSSSRVKIMSSSGPGKESGVVELDHDGCGQGQGGGPGHSGLCSILENSALASGGPSEDLELDKS